jgi:hypothetical protein
LNQQRLVKYQTQLIGSIDRRAPPWRRSHKSGCLRVLFHITSLTRRTCQRVVRSTGTRRLGQAVAVYRSSYGIRTIADPVIMAIQRS